MAIWISRCESPRIDVFNPRRLTDRQIDALATSREDLLANWLATIVHNAQGGAIQHLALVAPRGYGKSFLLRQLRRKVEELAAQGHPLAFAHLPEELPNVTSVARLVDEVRRLMVGDLSGGIGHFRDEAPDALDRAIAGLDTALDQRFGPGRGLVIAAVENFDELMDKLARLAARAGRRRGLPKGERVAAGVRPEDRTVELALRGVISRPGNRLMLAISATHNIRNDNPEHPLFQWIREQPLEPWTEPEVLAYALRRRRLSRGVAAELTRQEQIQLKALTLFSGGAPRMIAVLVDHLLEQDLEHATLNLAALIDELTPYYQHRLGDLSDECQLVFDTLLRGREPASQTEIAQRFAEEGLSQSALAEAFRRLQAERLILGHKEQGGSGRAMLYQATDRVMAYWYKQRQVIGHDPALSAVSHFEEAVELLVAWFSRDDLQLEAESFARCGRRDEAAVLLRLSRHGIGRALSPGEGAVQPGAPRRHLAFGFILRLDLLRRLLEPADQAAAQAILDALRAGVSRELIERLDRESRGGDGRLHIFRLCALAVAHCLREPASNHEDARAEAVLYEALGAAEGDGDAVVMVRNLGSMLLEPVFRDLDRALAMGGATIDPDRTSSPEAGLAAAMTLSWANWHRKDYQRSLHQAETARELARRLELTAWEGRSLQMMAHALAGLGRKEDALLPARESIEFLQEAQNLGRAAEALGLVAWLLFELDRHAESLEAARQTGDWALAVEDFGNACDGFALQSACLAQLERHDEALAAARQALDLARTARDFDREANATEAVVVRLQRLRQFEEMLVTARGLEARAALHHDTSVQARSLYLQGDALDNLERRDEAITALRKAIDLGLGDETQRQAAMSLLGYCLGMTGKHTEAITALTEAAELAERLGDASSRTTDLRNMMIFAGRMPQDMDFTACGAQILAGFESLARLDSGQAAEHLPVALYVAAALDQQQAFFDRLRDLGWQVIPESEPLAVLAEQLSRISAQEGRAKGYAAILSALNALTPPADAAEAAPDPRTWLIRGLALRLRDPGLLLDVADLLEEQGLAADSAEVVTLRTRAQALAEDLQPEALERLDPDLVASLQAMTKIPYLPTGLPRTGDPDLGVRPCVVSPDGAATFAGLPLAPASAELTARFAAEVPRLGIANLEAFDRVELRTAALPFLPEAHLVLLPHRGGELAVPFVLHPDGLVLAGRTNDWIYNLMGHRPPLDLAEAAAAEAVLRAYVRFFFMVINSDLGSFRFIEYPAAITWLPTATDAERERLAALVTPMERLANQGGRAVLGATVVFRNGLFRTLVRIQADGMIELADPELLAEDLPLAFGPMLDLVVAE